MLDFSVCSLFVIIWNSNLKYLLIWAKYLYLSWLTTIWWQVNVNQFLLYFLIEHFWNSMLFSSIAWSNVIGIYAAPNQMKCVSPFQDGFRFVDLNFLFSFWNIFLRDSFRISAIHHILGSLWSRKLAFGIDLVPLFICFSDLKCRD